MRSWLLIATFCVFSFFDTTVRGQTPQITAQIKKLLTLHSIEAKANDVKKLLGEPLSRAPDFYQLQEINVLVSYQLSSSCNPNCVEQTEYCGWNVPLDTLITLAIIVKRRLHQDDLQKLGIELSKYERDKEADHLQGTVYYSNSEQGLRVIVNGNQVESISLFPATKYHDLTCSRSKAKSGCSASKNLTP